MRAAERTKNHSVVMYTLAYIYFNIIVKCLFAHLLHMVVVVVAVVAVACSNKLMEKASTTNFFTRSLHLQ